MYIMKLKVDKSYNNDADKCIMRLDSRTLITLGIHPKTVVELIPNLDDGYDVVPKLETSGKIDDFPDVVRQKNDRLIFVIMQQNVNDGYQKRVRIDGQDRDLLNLKEGDNLNLSRCEEWEIE